MLVRSIAIAVLGLICAGASAQEPINAEESATGPSPGHAVLKEQFRYTSLRLDNGSEERQGRIRDAVLETTLNVGITRNLSLSLRAPVMFRSRGFDDGGAREHDQGLGDALVQVKYRFLAHDSGPLDTLRASVVTGVQVRSGDSPFTHDGYNPTLGLALTQIRGRHGLNADLVWTFTTRGTDDAILAGETTADLLRYDVAYLYRLHPVEYKEDTLGAWYAVLELNGFYETNGDNEVLISPGLMYEAAWWTVELSVQLPAWRDVAERAHTEFGVVAGVRFSF